MAQCNICGAETSLYDSGIPICIPCSDRSPKEIRERRLELSRKQRETPDRAPEKKAGGP